MFRTIRNVALIIGLTTLPDFVEGTDTSVPFILADQVHAMRISGQGVTVAVIDSGVCYEENGLGGGIAHGGISIINGDGTYGQGSFGDINPFVSLLSSHPLPIECP